MKMNGEMTKNVARAGGDDLDRLLMRHFQEELDPQRGRAARHFESVLGATVPAFPTRRRWIWAGVSALAASVVVGVVLRGVMRPEEPKVATPVVAGVEEGLLELERTVAWKTFDEGTVLMEDQTPMRKLRREVVERVQYYDPEQQAVVEMTVPKEEVFLVKLAMY